MLLIAIVALILSSCTIPPIASGDATPVRSAQDRASVTGGAQQSTVTPGVKEKTATHPVGTPTQTAQPADKVVSIALGDKTAVSGSGATVDGSTVRIIAGGTYSISGTLKNGQIVVETKDETAVNLILKGVTITSATSAPIFVRRAKSTIITLADGTKNQIVDASSYVLDDPDTGEPNAAIFSRGNLTFNGGGALTDEANYRDGISSKRALDITGGNVTVTAANDGIRGRDHIAISNGTIKVSAKADGMQSSNKDDPDQGFVSIEGGTVEIAAGQDGIQAETRAEVGGGTVTVSSGGGSANASNQPSDGTPSASAKGIKAVSDVNIGGGTITIDSADDAINSSGNIEIDDGKIALAAGDDGIHADSVLTVNGGDIRITKSYEAIEGAIIAIRGGSIRLAARDDGVNVAGGHNHSAANGGSSGDNSAAAVDKHLTIEGGYVWIDAKGDGLDINGWAKMTGGTVVVNGPVASDQGALDYDREFTMAGGTLVAVGSFGMAQAPDATSTQYSISLNLGSPQPAGTLVHIEAADGADLLTFAPIREYQTVVYSSPALKKGSTFSVFVGGKSTGSAVDGVYSGGTYTPGSRKARQTISSIVSGLVSLGTVPLERGHD